MNKLFSLLAIIFLATACNLYPGEDARTEQLDVVITAFNDASDFKSMQTYALSTHIKPIYPEGGTAPEIPNWLNNVVLNTIEANMASYGWELVDSTENPDMAIDVGYSKSRNTNIYGSYPGYGWGYPGYGWYYPWYSYSTITSYEVGSIVMIGLDLSNVNPQDSLLGSHWLGLIQGPVIGNVDDPQARVQRDVNQAFEQSTYLNIY